MKIFIAILASLFLSACGTAKVITASEQGIAVDVGGTEWTTSEMLKKGANIANDHCAKFGKKANFDSTSGFLGAATTAHFSCR
jgi:hypothetical protein